MAPVLSRLNLIMQAPVVQRADGTIHWMNHLPLDNSVNFDSTYPLGSGLSIG